MGIFSFLFNSKSNIKYNESKKTIQILHSWISSHFVSGSRYLSTQSNANQFVRLRKDNGDVISLDKIKIPHGKTTVTRRILHELKDLILSEDTDNLPHLIADYHKVFHQETQNFLNNLLQLDKLNATLKSDSFFGDIDHVFYVKLKILYNELVFCKFEELGNSAYFHKMNQTMQSLQKDMYTINKAFADYMYALTKTGYENTTQEIEMIKAMVAGMSEAVEEYVQ